jgi:ABC-type oligopeptide transport system substrate-binding subunit
MCKNMKKILAFALVLLVGIALFTSCKSSSKCAAYGETQKFQKEVRY